ncbi:MAG: DUF547 domain-containing protein [Bacteroidota bacterium]
MLAKILDFYLHIQNFLLGEPLARIHRRAKGTKPVSHDVWDQLLKKHLVAGNVDYKGFLQDRDRLQMYLDLLAQNPPNPRHWSVPERLAYWINAYNAFTVALVLQYYPLDSIKKLGPRLQVPFINSAWDLRFFEIGGIKMTLNIIEHQILRRHFEEPRIHFAINCASFSCPRLRDEAYLGDEMERQLEEQAYEFVNDPHKNRISASAAKLSQIFQWYEKDFVKKHSLREYINQYAQQAYKTDSPQTYIPYDWSLNEVKD